MRLRLGIHAGAGVADGEHGVFPRRGGVVLRRVAAVELDVARLDRELAARGHGVARVDREVHDHLLQLTGVGPDGAQRRSQHGRQLHVLAQQPAQHFLELAHEGVQVYHARLQHLLAAEGEQLAGEPGGAIRRLVNLVRILAPRVLGSQILEQQVGVPRDRGEDVVEVVRDTPRQSPHGFHLLRLAQLLLQQDALGDVPPDAQDTDEPVVAQLGRGRELGEAVIAPARMDAELRRGPLLAPHHPAEQLEGERQVLRVHELVERLAEPVAARRARDRFERGIERRDHPVGGEREDHVPHALHQRAVLLLGVAQRLLRVLALRDIAEVDHDGADGGLPEPVDDHRLHGAP